MPAIFRTDSGIFGDIQASNMVVTGEIKVGESQTTINQYISNEVNTLVGEGIDYSAEITTLSGNIDTVSGDLNALSGVVDGLNVGGEADLTKISGDLNIVSGRVDTISGDLVITNNTLNTATGNIDTISGAVEGILNAEAADDAAFNSVSGSVDTISGDLDTLEGIVDTATGNIDTISGAVEEILNAEAADDTAFNTVSGSVDTISGDLDTLEGIVDTATGNIDEISGVVQNLSANSTTYGDTDVSTYLGGNLDTHILPDTNETYDIGSADKKIRHLYLSSNSLYIGGEEGVTGTAISATAEGGIVLPSELNVSGINISGAIGGVQPNAENDSMQWNDSEKKWVAGDKLSTTANTLNTTTGDLYSFYKKENNTISNVSGNFNALNFQPTTIPTTKTSAGTKGEITYDENYVYLCVADNTWKRLPSADF